jgi:hypothetical protein
VYVLLSLKVKETLLSLTGSEPTGKAHYEYGKCTLKVKYKYKTVESSVGY